MSDRHAGDGARRLTPPFGTSQRIRNRAIWAVALFAAAVPPAFVGMGVAEVDGRTSQRRHAAGRRASG